MSEFLRVNLVAAISEAIGRMTVLTDQAKALRLRRINRVRTIHDSLAIEGNTLQQFFLVARGREIVAEIIPSIDGECEVL